VMVLERRTSLYVQWCTLAAARHREEELHLTQGKRLVMLPLVAPNSSVASKPENQKRSQLVVLLC